MYTLFTDVYYVLRNVKSYFWKLEM